LSSPSRGSAAVKKKSFNRPELSLTSILVTITAASSFMATEVLLVLREQLEKEIAQPDPSLDRFRDLIQQVAAVKMDIGLLKLSMVGLLFNKRLIPAINKIEGQTGTPLAEEASQMVKHWKTIAETKKPSGEAGEQERRKIPKKLSVQLMDGDIAQFYSKSKDADDLGLGIPDWRKVLSNFHIVTIEPHPGRYYASVEHAFHAAKARCSNKPEIALEFELGGAVGKTPLAAKRAGGRAAFERRGAALDRNKWDAERDRATLDALRSRLVVDSTFRTVLTEVHRRKIRLLHFERGGAKSYWGGSLNKDTGGINGVNRLGQMLVGIAAEVAATSGGAGQGIQAGAAGAAETAGGAQ
jgi:predicted NAD-dependent protein-ADP-ribosyltransferase YbiA (DUF1768 family)